MSHTAYTSSQQQPHLTPTGLLCCFPCHLQHPRPSLLASPPSTLESLLFLSHPLHLSVSLLLFVAVWFSLHLSLLFRARFVVSSLRFPPCTFRSSLRLCRLCPLCLPYCRPVCLTAGCSRRSAVTLSRLAPAATHRAALYSSSMLHSHRRVIAVLCPAAVYRLV